MQKADVLAKITEIYKSNSFMHLCGIQIKGIGCGQATVGLVIDGARHTNVNGKLHGGLLMTLMDNATGIAAASRGKRVVTVSMTVDFIKGAQAGDAVEAHAEIRYMDTANITMEINIYNAATGKLLATGMSCMMIIDTFSGIPESWQ